MNSALALQVMRFGFLALLWLFVYGAIRVVRTDLRHSGQSRVGTPPTARRRGKGQSKRAPARSAGTGPSHLIVTDGALKGTRIGLTGTPILIGRGSDAAIRLDDDYVSTRHARIAASGDQWFVEDLGSTNGTYVGTVRITQPTTISLGTQVRIGKTVLELRK